MRYVNINLSFDVYQAKNAIEKVDVFRDSEHGEFLYDYTFVRKNGSYNCVLSPGTSYSRYKNVLTLKLRIPYKGESSSLLVKKYIDDFSKQS